MVESSDTDKPAKNAVCETCGKAVGAAVSGSDKAWSFKPVCRCSMGAPSNADKTDENPALEKEEPDTKPTPSGSSTESTASTTGQVLDVKNESREETSVFKEDDSGGWASITSAKTASGPDFSKARKSVSSDSGSWTNSSSPKSFSGDMMKSADSHESWISLGGSDFTGPPVDDFNRPVAHEIGKCSSSGATSGSASSSGTNLGGSYSSGTNLSGAGSSGAFTRGKTSNRTAEEPVDWVPVKQKPVEASKSQFADDTELLDLTHKTETAEEKIRPSTRKSIQDAFRRNRIKTMVIAVIALVLACGFYSYASNKGLIKKIGILNQGSNSNQPSKKGSGRHSKKNKRTK